MMMIIRPIKEQDMEAFIHIAFTAGIGMTSMPKNRSVLEALITKSLHSFAADISTPGPERYLFVLEDAETGSVEGTSSIIAKTFRNQPFYFYHLDPPAEHNNNLPTLRIIKYNEMPTEICSLYLMAPARHAGIGRLLSLSRFLFIASHRHRFDSRVFAEIRGNADKQQQSVFWNGIGRHFFDMEFATLMHLRDEDDFDLHRLLPNHPIYLPLLPSKVQKAIGQVHRHAEAALNMLFEEGFHYSNDIDICDGGPKIEAETDQIRTVKDSIVDTVKKIIKEPIEAPVHLISNTRTDFRACLGLVQPHKDEGVIITKAVAHALQIDVGDSIRYIPAHHKKRSS